MEELRQKCQKLEASEGPNLSPVEKAEIALKFSKVALEQAHLALEQARLVKDALKIQTATNFAREAHVALHMAHHDKEVAVAERKLAEAEGELAEEKGELAAVEDKCETTTDDVLKPMYRQFVIEMMSNIQQMTATIQQMTAWIDRMAEKREETMQAATKKAEELYPNAIKDVRNANRGKISWTGVSKQVSTLKFKQNNLKFDDASQMKVLGPLYKPGFPWPVQQQTWTIDMRLAPYDLFHPDVEDKLRPAARLLNDMISVAESDAAVALIGVSGVGKSSALIDLGRVQFVFNLLVSDGPTLGSVQSMARKSRELDANFVNLFHELFRQLGPGANNDEAGHNWNFACHRFQVELVSRVLQLVRLFREKEGKVDPWMFTAHQLAGPQNFVGEMVEVIRYADEDSLKEILQGAMAEIAELTSKYKFVVAVDGIEVARFLLQDRIRRPESSGSTGDQPKGLLSPLCHAISSFGVIVKWSVVLAGTGTSEDCVRGLKTDLGKLQLSKNIISDRPAFPLTDAAIVIRLIGRLNISEALRKRLRGIKSASPLRQPAAVSGGKRLTTVSKITSILEDYVVEARFRVLCGAIEHISKSPKKLNNSKDTNEILFEALQMSVTRHTSDLVELLEVRLDPKHPNGLREGLTNHYLNHLLQITIAAQISDGKMRIQGLKGKDYDSNATDLTRLGIAAASTISDESLVEYTVCERFVLDAIHLLFETDRRLLDTAVKAKFEKLLVTLKDVISVIGTKGPFKGNVIKRMILERMVTLGNKSSKVTDLPFFPQAAKDSWNQFEFRPNEVVHYDADVHWTPDFLASPEACSAVYSPESVCGPDGIIMLSGKTRVARRAISIGVALYSEPVPRKEVERQYWSTDLSRAFLSTTHEVHPTTQERRAAWFAKGLHKTVSLRVQICIPHAPSAFEFTSQNHRRETTMEGEAASEEYEEDEGDIDGDVIVNIDKSNLHLVLGKPSDGEQMKKLYDLVEVATGHSEGWCCSDEV